MNQIEATASKCAQETLRHPCKLLHVNPESYLTWVLPKLAAATTKTAHGLLPHDYAALQRS